VEEHTARVSFHEITVGLGGAQVTVPSGFTCGSVVVQAMVPLVQSEFLAERLEEPGPYQANLVVDFIGLGGAPGCRPFEIEAWCGDRPCTSVFRRCVPLSLDPPPARLLRDRGPLLARNVGTAVKAAEAFTITEDAPDDVVLVRAVATTQSCDGLADDPAARLDPSAVLGCAYSCPVQLDDVTEPIVLAQPAAVIEQLGTGTPLCVPATASCANDFRPVDGVDARENRP
jgi:hypothetical protein